jgi:hypothetical protein
MERAKKLAASIISAAIPALIVASLTIYALILNNNQGEAFDTTTGLFRYWYLSKIFLISFNAIFLPVLALLCAIFSRKLREE